MFLFSKVAHANSNWPRYLELFHKHQNLATELHHEHDKLLGNKYRLMDSMCSSMIKANLQMDLKKRKM